MLGASSLTAQILPHSSFDSTLRRPAPTCSEWISQEGTATFGHNIVSQTKVLQKNDNSPLDIRELFFSEGSFSSPDGPRIAPATGRMPFFCRQEARQEKWTGIPLRLRVGSLEDCDWLEQKPNALIPTR